MTDVKQSLRSRRGRVLVVDDEPNARSALAELLRGEGYTVETAADGFKALAKTAELDPDVVLTDLKMPGMDGIELMQKLRSQDPDVSVLVMTAFGAVETAVRAMQQGATSYLTKPINLDELLLVLDRALEHRALRVESQELKRELQDHRGSHKIIGSSPGMQEVLAQVALVAPSRATVLLTGESGTGKELIAAALHEASPRARGPFIKLHCAALAESLLESELFGHERGAFTGAERRREGRFERANGGTLFLDEVGEIPLNMQVKLLRVLQEREFERVGGTHPVQTDVRLVAATHRDLKQLVAEGRFREDLYYRLRVIEIHLPPLRSRSGDLSALAMYFLERHARDNGRTVTGFSAEAMAALHRYGWPGNVRELENVIERAVVLAQSPLIELRQLPAELVADGSAERSGPSAPHATLEELERHAILTTLEAVGGSTSRAAEVLGISVRKVQYKLQQYGAAPKSAVPAVTPRERRPSRPGSSS